MAGSEQKQGIEIPFAQPPDMLRAARKDLFYSSMLRDKVFDIVSRLLNPRFTVLFQEEIRVFSDIIYYCLTTLRGVQTLGEEYCDMLQVTASQDAVTTKKRLILFVCQIVVPYTINKTIRKLQILQNQATTKDGTMKAVLKNVSKKWLSDIREVVSLVERFHMGVFYIHGSYCSLSKRFAGIRYLYLNRLDQRRPTYSALGVLIYLQILLSLMLKMRSGGQPTLQEDPSLPEESRERTDVNGVIIEHRCSLCLEERRHCSTTPCGHLFCWICIHEALQVKKECPVCRTAVQPQEILRLHCY